MGKGRGETGDPYDKLYAVAIQSAGGDSLNDSGPSYLSACPLRHCMWDTLNNMAPSPAFCVVALLSSTCDVLTG